MIMMALCMLFCGCAKNGAERGIARHHTSEDKDMKEIYFAGGMLLGNGAFLFAGVRSDRDRSWICQ